MLGKFVNIKYYEIHDGDGLRTTVFLKGCPLSCKWCHNPECLSFKNEIGFYQDKCKMCRLCEMVCPNKCHSFVDGKHVFDKTKCNSCGKCVEACTSHSLVSFGRDIDSKDLVDLLLKDSLFFKELNEGVTISGGEPLAQFEFTLDLCKRLKEKNVDVSLDTTLYVQKEKLVKLLPYIDTFLVDMKAYSSDLHKKLTGVNNEIIKENIQLLDSLNKRIEIRVPFIPSCNENEMEDIANFLKDIKCISGLKVLPYHFYAKDKYNSLGLDYSLDGIDRPNEDKIENARNIFRKAGIKVIIDN